MDEVVSKEDFQEYLTKFKNWKEQPSPSLANLMKRLLAVKFTKEFQTMIEAVFSGVFKEVVNSELAEKTLIGELTKLKKKIKDNEKVLQQQEKLDKLKVDTKAHKEAVFPEELVSKLEGRQCDYVRHLYKSFTKNFAEADKRQSNIIEFVRKLAKEISDSFEGTPAFNLGDDAKILKLLTEIRFNMEPVSTTSSKRSMLQGDITIKEIIQNKTSIYVDQSRKSSLDDDDKKVAPDFPKGHG